ncbi:hypothetical protein O0L34_g1026 [Tuta absoluta]|nr:hypothetical protein O0L34_g1026 [Tuta absoluta]
MAEKDPLDVEKKKGEAPVISKVRLLESVTEKRPSALKTDTEKKLLTAGQIVKKTSIEDDKDTKPSSIQLERKDRADSGVPGMSSLDVGGLDTVIELNEAADNDIDRPIEVGDFIEDPPRIFSLKDILEPLTIESLKNAIYEMGVVNLCWPEITEPVFETRKSFPESYYKNSNKERLLLAYAECFRRQYHFRYHKKPFYRKPLFLQCPNECELQKMVCTTVRPTKLCHAGTNTWQGLASLVADYFIYEPLEKPMLHVST